MGYLFAKLSHTPIFFYWDRAQREFTPATFRPTHLKCRNQIEGAHRLLNARHHLTINPAPGTPKRAMNTLAEEMDQLMSRLQRARHEKLCTEAECKSAATKWLFAGSGISPNDGIRPIQLKKSASNMRLLHQLDGFTRQPRPPRRPANSSYFETMAGLPLSFGYLAR